MKTFSSTMRTLPLLVVLASVGCGGNGHSSSNGGGTASGLSVQASADFDGSKAALAGTTTSTATTDATGIVLKSGGRALLLNLPTARLTEGTTLKIGEAGVSAAYGETSNGSTNNWKAMDGSIIVTKLVGKKATLQFTGLAFAKDDGAANNGATGTFQIDGSLSNITLGTVPGGGTTNPGTDALTFSEAVGTNAIVTNFGNDAVATFDETVNTNVDLFSIDASNRVVGFVTLGKVTVGQSFDLSKGGDLYTLTYAQNRNGSTQNWSAVSGMVTVTAKSATTITIKIANAHFQPVGDGAINTATGTFTLNGSIKKA